jgi:hypothetical protein
LKGVDIMVAQSVETLKSSARELRFVDYNKEVNSLKAMSCDVSCPCGTVPMEIGDPQEETLLREAGYVQFNYKYGQGPC